MSFSPLLTSVIAVAVLWLAAAQPPGPAAACAFHHNVSSSELEAFLIAGECVDTHEQCAEWAEEGECEVNDGFMLESCPCSCNSCPSFVENHWDDEPQIAYGPLKDEIQYIIQKTEAYMKESVYAKKDQCRNKHRGCSHWSLLGECEKNPRWMLEDCAPACQACHRMPKRR
ncbi:prolyl 4-hydroxylase [Seminavis robusta]|uniref:Prolyl 4-hydroxylase n=1 Tax=Seminavis robusta TaxID=568900 RepID=A0A9N8HEN5_9STRA|nr:prolyl 4-hydroxylase [Seminavis robusta]|eukprot:Sro482_g151910.1 prolyl 4-hydroxylase (171) ;mRNA; r:59553-60165